MLNIFRKVDVDKLPHRKTVIQFIFPELYKNKVFWLVHKPGFKLDLCTKDPAFDVDLYVKADLKTLTSVWIGLAKLCEELENKNIVLICDEKISSSISNWMVRSSLLEKCNNKLHPFLHKETFNNRSKLTINLPVFLFSQKNP